MNLPPVLTELERDIIEVLIRHSVVDEKSLRYFRIRQRYLQLTLLKNGTEGNKFSKKQIRQIIAGEYFITDWTVQRIIYYKNYKQ